MRKKFNPRTERDRGVAGDTAPIDFLPACKTAVVILWDVNTNRTIAIGRDRVNVAPPINIVETIGKKGEEGIGEDRAPDA